MECSSPSCGPAGNDDDHVNFFSDNITPIEKSLMCGRHIRTRAVASDVSTTYFVLVWETNDNSESYNDHKRQKFFRYLRESGILMEMKSLEEEANVHFMLLSAPWKILCTYAEKLNMRAPLQVLPSEPDICSIGVIGKLPCVHDDVPRKPCGVYTCPFKAFNINNYLGSEDQKTFFSNTQRHQILYEFLATAPYGKCSASEIGVERLLNENVFKAAYPLHDGNYSHVKGTDPSKLYKRQILYEYWARCLRSIKPQPLDHIRLYFGEKIAFYFAWLGFYTKWLIPPAVIGVTIVATGLIMMHGDVPAHYYRSEFEAFNASSQVYTSLAMGWDVLWPPIKILPFNLHTCCTVVTARKELCESKEKYRMCPLCKGCPVWKLSDSCMNYKLSLLFDHGGTLFFSIFMSVWAVTFLEFWKRRSNSLSYQWNCMNTTEIEEPPRPEFAARAPEVMENPVTGIMEPYFPQWVRTCRIIVGYVAIILMINMVVIFIICVTLYRIIIFSVLVEDGGEAVIESSHRIANITSSIVNVICIVMFSKVYSSVAEMLTRWEMHRTQSAYEDALALKVYLFEFVNNYASPIYIAFLKGRFVGYPGNYKTIFHLRNETCGTGGCLIELAEEMMIIMLGKQIICNLMEYVTPKVMQWWNRRDLKKKKTKVPEEGKAWERDYELAEFPGMFEEYLEIVLQFGFITFFVAACPLAPLFALINNCLEVRLDAHKFVCDYRRPVAGRAGKIGIWMPIMEVITYMAVIINALLMAFTSNFLSRIYYMYATNGDLRGYIDFTLAQSPISYAVNNTACRYQSFQTLDGSPSKHHWRLLAVQLMFVFVFEHLVFSIGRLVGCLIPDVPQSVENKMQRERYLGEQALAGNKLMEKDLTKHTESKPRHRSDEPTCTITIDSNRTQ